MANKHGKAITQFYIKGEMVSLRTTDHAQERMEQREVNEFVVAGAVLSLGEKLFEIDENEDFAIIDNDNDTIVIGSRTKNTVYVITVLPRANCYVKEGTKIAKI